jgi:quinol monooxygenase YgiN
MGDLSRAIVSEMSYTVVLVSYRALPGRIDEALAAIGTLIAAVRAVESDCGGITLLQDAGDPTHIRLVERWTSQEVFLGTHMRQPHIQAFIQSASSFLTGPPDITFWRQVSDT